MLKKGASTAGPPPDSLEPPTEYVLGTTEKHFLLSAERGDVATVKRLLEEHDGHPEILNIDCVDPLNRSALISAIENENVELVNLLLEKGIQVKDALLHAIREEYVEAVELLLEWEEKTHVAGQPYVSLAYLFNDVFKSIFKPGMQFNF